MMIRVEDAIHSLVIFFIRHIPKYHQLLKKIMEMKEKVLLWILTVKDKKGKMHIYIIKNILSLIMSILSDRRRISILMGSNSFVIA